MDVSGILCVHAVGDHMPWSELDRSTSKLAVSHQVLLFPSGLNTNTTHHHCYKRSMGDAITSRVRAIA